MSPRADRRPLHVRLLRLLRDEGAVSRAELGDRLQMPRPRLLAELDRLVALGYVAEAGLAASRGGRRSTLVELNPKLRFAAVDLGASSMDVEVVNGRLEPVAHYAEPADIRNGPKVTLQRVNELLHKARVDGAYERLDAVGIGVPGPVSFRDGVPVSPDHARLGPLSGARAAHPGARLPGGRRQRRQHHGDRRAARRRRPLGGRLPLREDRHRNRVRHLPQR
ncbi:hypothetical protein GCM10027614_30880 [Micromonospora vulcania]